MAAIRVTMLMSVGRYAWSESHWTAKYGDLLAAAADVKSGIMAKRAALFGTQTSFLGVRLNTVGVRRDAMTLRPPVMPTAPGLLAVTAGTTADNSSDIEDVAVVCRGVSGTNRAKNFYMRGCPDVAEGNAYGPRKINPNAASFLTAVNDYFKYLVDNGWGFMGRTLADNSQVVSAITADAAPPTKYGITAAAALAGVGVGSFIQLRGFTVRKGTHRVNGIYQVAGPATSFAASPPVYWLQNSLGIDPASITKWGKAEPVTFQHCPYSLVAMSYVKRRATGGRTALPVGRRKTRS